MSRLGLADRMFLALHLADSVILTVIADAWYTKRPLVSGLDQRKIHYLEKGFTTYTKIPYLELMHGFNVKISAIEIAMRKILE